MRFKIDAGAIIAAIISAGGVMAVAQQSGYDVADSVCATASCQSCVSGSFVDNSCDSGKGCYSYKCTDATQFDACIYSGNGGTCRDRNNNQVTCSTNCKKYDCMACDTMGQCQACPCPPDGGQAANGYNYWDGCVQVIGPGGP